MKWFAFCAMCLVAFSVSAVSVLGGGADGKAKHSVKEVMQNAHKAGLLKKVLAGSASQEEKLTLLDHYVSLTENQPKKGSPEGWQAKTNAIVVAAAKVAVGRDDGNELLTATTNCAACHNDHKGK